MFLSLNICCNVNHIIRSNIVLSRRFPHFQGYHKILFPSMTEKERTLDMIKKELRELNFNINEKVIENIYKLFEESVKEGADKVTKEDQLDAFIKGLISKDTLVELQISGGVNDDGDFDKSWKGFRRSSVYSEKISPGSFNLRYHPKDKETVNFLDSILVCDIPFGFLNPGQKAKLIGSMVPESVERGKVIIREGDVGSRMYIVESGEFEVTKSDKVLNKLARGSFFGEIALLHNVPRTATVKATMNSKIWVVEQTAFAGIKMMDRISNKKTILEGLKEQGVFPLLSNDGYEPILDALSFVYYEKGCDVEIMDSEFFMTVVEGEIDDGKARKIKPKEILRSKFKTITPIQGAHIRNKQRVGFSKFLDYGTG